MTTPSGTHKSEAFMVGEISVSPQHNMITKEDQSCRVQPKAMAVLLYLAQHHERVINNDELLDHVWQGRVVTHSSIQKSVNVLRSAFKELDSSFEYVVYYSKRGYQLVFPPQNSSASSLTINTDTSPYFKKVSTSLVVAIVVTMVAAYLAYLFNPMQRNDKTASTITKSAPFIQVKPFVSNTGRETIIAPHFKSSRVAFVREDYSGDMSGDILNENKKKSYLYIQGTNGQQWQVSSARGSFVNLAWSPSGRNLVAIDAHQKNSTSLTDDETLPSYYSFHVYTLDYKAERIIEKNLLSHWAGHVTSVSWWDEGTLEFIASHGNDSKRDRYRYDVAEQNLATLNDLTDLSDLSEDGEIISSKIFNKKTALLHRVNNEERIQLLNESQQHIASWLTPYAVKSLNWLSNGQGLLLLSYDNQLSMLTTNGEIHPISYSPKIKGNIEHARSKDNGKSIVLTVKAPTEEAYLPKLDMIDDEEGENIAFSQIRFLQKGGGFIYSAANVE